MLYSKHRPIFVEEGNTHNKTEIGKKKTFGNFTPIFNFS